ncbi:MAG TPA: hypothetical protein VIJ42_15275, partial [Stellaceae bacterium]
MIGLSSGQPTGRGRPAPAPVIDPAIDGMLDALPSRDARRQGLALGTLAAALLLHLLFLGLLSAQWRDVAAPAARPLQVTLVREPPKPPPLPPAPKPEPP